MWKFTILIVICSSLFFSTKSELMCHQKGDYCEVKEPVEERLAGNLLNKYFIAEPTK